MDDIIDNPQPRRLLLATDMTARCDRPLDRAKQLALEWRADLTVLVVQQPPCDTLLVRAPDGARGGDDG